MKLALVGYGKMGHMIESLAPEYGGTIELRLDEYNNPNGDGLTQANFRDIDVAIEFSTPQAVIGNLEKLIRMRVPTVVGTTGWDGNREDIRHLAQEHGTPIVWSSNYSIGVQIFSRVVREAAALLQAQPEYEAWGWEIHHGAKKDAPSGTMGRLLDVIREAGFSRDVNVASNRAGKVPGTHEIGFDSAADTITLRHTARSREGFARGALKAAQWLPGQTGFHEFGDILFENRQVR